MSTIVKVEPYLFDSLTRWTATLDCGHTVHLLQDKPPKVGAARAGKHTLNCPCKLPGKKP